MPLAAGHTIASQQKYALDIDESISRFAYLKDKPYVWHDLADEPAYEPHPEATRPYRSMISIPIHGGEKIWGVFNVVSTVASSFEDVDVEYVKLLGSIIDVTTSVILAGRSGSGSREIESGSD
jgi:GAF domain-containing protein